MTDEQNKKYWRRWAAICRLNHWRWSKGRVADEAVIDASQHHAQVWRIAQGLADQTCRAVTADDLRHACHIYALGKDVSHSSFTNDQFNRLLLLWGNEREIRGLLADPDDIRAQTYWDNPDLQKKESLVKAIRAAASDVYIQRITADIWGTIYWEDLDAKTLLGLLRKLKGNAPARAGQPF